MTWDHRRNPEADAIPLAHCLPRRREGSTSQRAAEQARDGRAALPGLLTQFKEVVRSHGPKAAAAAALYAAGGFGLRGVLVADEHGVESVSPLVVETSYPYWVLSRQDWEPVVWEG